MRRLSFLKSYIRQHVASDHIACWQALDLVEERLATEEAMFYP